MSQIAAADFQKACSVAPLLVLHPSAELQGGERRYQPDRLVQVFRLARLTG
jgi:hypothetical protein